MGGVSWVEGIESKSLRRALDAVHLRELPPLYNERYGFWLRALVLMKRAGGVSGWCVCERDARGVMRMVRDFGEPPLPTVGVERIHPYEYLDEVSYKVLYADEGDCRKKLRAFYLEREVGLGAGKGEDARKKLRMETEGRIKLCEGGSVEDLAWMDRERMIYRMRAASRKAERLQVRRPAEAGDTEEYGSGAAIRTIDSGGLTVERPKRGRPSSKGVAKGAVKRASTAVKRTKKST